MSGIIWLASYPKSGNTWIRAFLANYLHDGTEPLAINQLHRHDRIFVDNVIAHYEMASGLKAEELTRETIATYRPIIHQGFARAKSHEVFVKTHNAVLIADDVPLITPSATAGAIYVMRNPLDVAVSLADHFQVDLAKAVESLCDDELRLGAMTNLHLPQYLGSWSRHVLSWTQAPGLTRFVARYEDLSRDPQATFGALVRFLGFPDHPARLERAIKFSSFKELSGQEERDPFAEIGPYGAAKFFRKGEVGAWRQALSQGQVAALIESQRQVMTAFGYLDAEGKVTV